MTVREENEALESRILSPFAIKACDSQGREHPEEECQYRTMFQRDRDRVIHSSSFRRLKHKTQVFLSPEGDHYRTRLTHTLEVSQIARTIARALRLNEDLTEAIALAHDLGHTPFGHAGERALDEILEDGFRHYEQGVRVVEKLERKGKGLNLTYEVREGIDRHTNGAWSQTREGQIVRWADQIAYINHDLDDAMHAGVMGELDIPFDVRNVLGTSRKERLDTLITNVISHGVESIGMEPEIEEAFLSLRKVMFDCLYFNPDVKGEEVKAVSLLQSLFSYYCEHPDAMPEEYQYTIEREGSERACADYIAGMTDNYALELYNDLFIPKSWNFK